MQPTWRLSHLPVLTEAVNGQIFVFFVMTVAAAEVAVGLALIVAIFHTKQSIDVDQMNIDERLSRR